MKNAWAKFRGWTWWQQTLGWIGATFIGLIILGAIVGEEDSGGGGGGGDSQSTTAAKEERGCTQPTRLTVTSPRDGSVVHKRKVRVKGRTVPDARVQLHPDTVGTDVTVTARGDGTFAHTARLGTGPQQIEIVATGGGCPSSDEFGLDITRERTAAELAVIRQKRAEEKARKEAARAQYAANYKASAKTIPFKELSKDPSDYEGTKVTYRGQVFQIQEEGSSTWMLLSVTDEGYDFWSDEIYVEYDGETSAVEEDVITVYGRVTGTEDYETKIGGSNSVPKVKAKYIEE